MKKNKLDKLLKLSLITLTIVGLFSVMLYLEDRQAKPTTDVKALYNLPNIDVVINDNTLMYASQEYIFQLKRSGKTNAKYASELFMKNIRPTINYFIDTSGGSIDTAIAITQNMHGLISMGFQINCYTVRAFSSGFTVLQSCSRRIILKGGLLAIHKAHGSTKYLNTISDLQRAVYEVHKTGKTRRELVEMRTDDAKFFTAEEALKANFVDEVM